MLDSKEDYRFVTEDALKNVTIKGEPYLARSQKLVLLGEDKAFFEEGYRERLYAAQPANVEQERPVAKYDTRIRVIEESCDEWHDRIVSLVLGYAWYERSRIEDIQAPQNPMVSANGTNEDWWERWSEAQQAISDGNARISAKRQELNDYIGHPTRGEEDPATGLWATLENALRAEDERWDDGREINEARAAYRSRVEELDAGLEETLADLLETHEDNVKSIKESEEYKEASAYEKFVMIAKENDRYGLAVQKANNRRNADATDAEDTMNKAVARAYKTHEDNISEAQKEFDEAKDEKTRETEDAILGIRNAADDEATGILSDCDVFGEEDFMIAHSRKLRERDAEFAKFTIKGSFADGFYRRKQLYKPASTPTNRVFADLEHLDTKVGEDIVFARCAYWESYEVESGAVLNKVFHDYGANGFGSIENFDNWPHSTGRGHSTYGSRDFCFRFGKRHNCEDIEKIVADVLILRNDYSSSDGHPRNITVCVKRLTFGRSGDVLEKNYVDRLDRIEDDLAEDISDINAEWSLKKNEADDAYRAEIDRLAGVRDSAIADATSTYESEVRDHNEAFVSGLYERSRGWNDRLREEGADKDAIWEEINEAISSARASRDEADEQSLGDLEAARSSANEAYDNGVEAAAEARRNALDGYERTYGGRIAELNSRAAESRQGVYDDRKDAIDEIEKTFRDAKGSAGDELIAAEESARASAWDRMNAQYPGHSPDDADPWWGQYYESGHIYIIRGDVDPGFVAGVNNDTDAAMASARDKYNSKVQSAEETRWEAMKAFPGLDLNRRLMFKAEVTPADGAVYDSGHVEVIGYRNVAVYFDMRAKTGADIDDYIDEMWDEKEDDGDDED